MRAAIAQRGERIGGFARLRHEQGRAAGVERRLAIAELRGDIDIDGEPGPSLEPVFSNQAGIERGAARRQRQPVELGEVERQRGNVDAVRGEIDIGHQRMADHLRLLVDLLGHEVAMVAFVDQESRRQRTGDRTLDRLAVAVADGDALPPQHRPIAVLEIDDRVGERRQRDCIGAHEHLAIAEPDGERTALARHDHQIVVPAEDHSERKGAFQPLQRIVDGAHRVVAGLQLAGDEMSDHLSVSVAGEGGAVAHQLFFQLTEILDDAVMHHRHQLGHMRVGIGFDRLAMGGPAGMADAGVAHQRLALEAVFEITQLAFGAPPRQVAVLDSGDARGIVAAIFEALQRVDQLFGDRPFAEDANDAAHRPLLLRTFAMC